MKRYLRPGLVLFVCWTVTFAAGVQQGPAPSGMPPASPGAGIDSVLNRPSLTAARWGIRVIRTDGSPVFERDSDHVFIPASNMKLYITAAALERFGPDHRFRTSVYADGPVDRRGTLRGDLVLYGRGDPNISARFTRPDNIDDFVPTETIPGIESLADQIAASGVRQVTRDLIADDSYFATDPPGGGWEWDDLQFYYGAPISALTVNDNAVTFVVTPGTPGQPPAISMLPRTSAVRIVNRAVTRPAPAGRPRIGVHRPPGQNNVEFFGHTYAGAAPSQFHISVPDAAALAGALLREALERRGVRVSGRVRTVDAVGRLDRPIATEKLRELAAIESRPLSTLIQVVNRPSQNLHAELLLRHLGAGSSAPLDDYGRPVKSEALGIEFLRAFLERAGVNTGSLNFRDGSGLSRHNLVTPRSTSELLRFMRSHPHFNPFFDSLPVAGAEGTLRERLRGASATITVSAKTGSMSFVSAISGYLRTRSGETLIFSFMSNNYPGPSRDVTGVFDEIFLLLSEVEPLAPPPQPIR